jgi:hypothetical protein
MFVISDLFGFVSMEHNELAPDVWINNAIYTDTAICPICLAADFMQWTLDLIKFWPLPVLQFSQVVQDILQFFVLLSRKSVIPFLDNLPSTLGHEASKRP